MWNKQEVQMITVEVTSANVEELITNELKGLVDECLQQGKIHIILNLSEVNHIGSMGLGAIVGAYKKILVHAGSLKIIGVKSDVATIFRLAGIIDTLEIHLRS